MRVLWLTMTAVVLAACAPAPAVQNNRGNALHAAGSYDAAVLAYQAAQVDAPDAPQPYYNAGVAFAEQGDLAAAQAALEQSVRRADDTLIGQAYYNLGNVHFRQANYAAAVDAYQAVLVRDPTNADARYNLELALSRLPTSTPTLAPTPTSMPDQPTEDTAAPTASPTATATATSTPSPSPGAPPDSGAATPSPQPGEPTSATETAATAPVPDGALNLEAAERNLDAVQQDQSTLRLFDVGSGTPDVPTDKNW